MLIDTDKKSFLELLQATGEIYNRPNVSPTMARLFWGALRRWDLAQIERALEVHVRSSKFMPTIADLVEILDIGNRRPGADEAWAMLPKDEESSEVVTREMLGAYAVAAELIHQGDLVAARMAFRDTYRRLCEESRAQGRPVEWVISRGWDKSSLGAAVTKALEDGRLTRDQAAPILAEIDYQAPMVAGLLEGTKGTPNEDKAREFLANLRESLKPKRSVVDFEAVRQEVEQRDQEFPRGKS